MSNYTKSTNFATKDALASGNPAKIVKGTEIDTEFNNIATAIATKTDNSNANITGGTITGITDLAIADGGTGASTAAGAAANLASEFGKLLYPVGSIYVNATSSTNPATLLGFGTWVAFGAGRVMVGFDSGNSLFDTAEETGGSADAIVVSHTHTASVTDSGHNHDYYRPNINIATTPGGAFQVVNSNETLTQTSTETTGITVTNSTTGSSGTNANYQPYITVYMWKRTA
jgi:hypothetical protein